MNIESALSDSANIFDLAPISLWLEDYSGLRRQFEEWRALGITDLKAFLQEDTSRLRICTSHIRVLKVNRKTLSLFEADSLDHLVTNLERVFRDDMLEPHIDEMVQLWNGDNAFVSDTVNYSLAGKRLDIQLKGVVLPGYEDTWERVLLSIEDVTARENARREQDRHKRHAQGLFEHSPVSLWVEDFSRIRQLMDDVRNRGIVDFRVFTDVHPEFVRQCMSEIRVLEINNETLSLFLAPDKKTLLQNLPKIFKDEMEASFREQLIDLWNGVLFQRREVVNYALDGTERHVLLQLSVLPGHEQDWALVQVALTDITARKKAEAYLEYLGKHDVLTKLHNRAFYVDELNRLERKGHTPVSVIIIDLNGLKAANDHWGHASGDGLLRRIGEVLNEAVKQPGHAARIGGDEFAVVLPYVDERGAEATVEEIRRLVDINNQYYSQLKLNLSIGTATSLPGEKLETVAKRADLLMYEDKRQQRTVTGL
ncbi:diguanylate cyclase (GGDEF)-like protein [Ochrobactrum daejeonense]|uniref:diguanylate cyclase n=1 Tax=Brucella daejeonensis TaxID=659015 RepID=A0A7W9AYQ3_9HYPH|nr:GGDEF domain-containing protein [Brucella daejeonensis]MBB5702877.1 diguanylate cyclase (GGDEF)-like protein [Brucella daejeonensis]NKB79631.1 sensor domain-containing diguanylate cyclase [Brucella daejeonensis]